LTFSGSGEPTLHSGIEKIIDFLKENYPEYKVSILTNGTLLSYKKVRNSIRNADIILPSLDAVSEELFKRIARPAEGITAKKLITGLIKLRNEFNGKIFIEYFVIPGLNDNIVELELIKNTLLKIKPDLIQLNTLDRPGAEDWISSAGSEKLHKIRSYLKPLRVEIVTDYKKADHNMINKKDEIADALISTIGRRPSTLHDLSVTLGIIPAELLKVIGHLLKNNIIEEENTDRGRFFKLKRV
ncbi:MAG: radical SAM protein, partial [Thermodesulfobacteriota bacterium]|nr:radical SAM protein [Thermodesulfobacteriota bacterium]